jgi:hypothetical protein
MIKKILIGIVALMVLLVSVFLIYTQIGVYDAVVQDLGERNDVGLYFPGNGEKVIFYPGGKVDYKAYNVLGQKLNDLGYDVTIVKMPLNLAVLGFGKAKDIEGSVIIGHSLGGSMAAKFAYDNEGRIDSLILLGAYPATSNNLSGRDVKVLSIYASEDGLATIDKIEMAKTLLPEDTHYELIEGGNHAQFGSYGPQKGDGTALISNEEQLDIVVKLIDQMIREKVK